MPRRDFGKGRRGAGERAAQHLAQSLVSFLRGVLLIVLHRLILP